MIPKLIILSGSACIEVAGEKGGQFLLLKGSARGEVKRLTARGAINHNEEQALKRSINDSPSLFNTSEELHQFLLLTERLAKRDNKLSNPFEKMLGRNRVTQAEAEQV